MKHCGTQELETERLVLRRLSIDDSEMMFNNWASDRQVTQYLRWNAHRSWGETAETLNEWEKHYGDPTFYQWGVENKRSGVLMGTISLFPAPELKTGWHLNTEILGSAWEAGYALGRKWWNNGYMTEALCAVRDYWFNTVDAPWLAAIHANENVASSAVLQKAGFVYDHDVIDHKFDGTAVPCCLDGEGRMALGNLLTQELTDILNTPRAQAIREGFSRRAPSEDLCRRCGYAARFSK